MDMTAATVATSARGAPRGLIPASFLLGGILLSLTGLTWDIQWHSDVGPDTFFTLPHLLLYAGSAATGLSSLIVVLATTAARRRGQPVDPIVGGRAVGMLGRMFAAPVGYLIAGLGAASFLLYGLWDQWWHGLYGFDAVIDSPPHIGLLLSGTVSMVGTIMVFAAARGQRWGTIGTILSVATLLTSSMVTVIGLEALPRGDVDSVDVGVAFVSVLLLVTGARVFDRRGAAAGVAIAVAALQLLFWLFSPWAARVYADAVGLPVRDYIDGVPVLPALIPMALIVFAALFEALRRLPAWLLGAAGGLIVALCAPIQRAWIYDFTIRDWSTVFLTAAAGLIVGALAGFLGARFGRILRHLAPTREVTHA